jgi:hypothetical protein
MQLIFTFETKYGKFTDALYLGEDHAFTEADIEAMKQERLSNWIAMIESPPTEEIQTVEEA